MSDIFDQQKNIKSIERPTWDEYFLSFAILAASRSPDTRTKCGCIFVQDHKIVSVGYNGFPAGVDDASLPNYGPEKYPYMVHAEANAIYNTTAPLKGATAYVSGYSCSECIKAMWQCGIKHIHYCEWSKPKMEHDKSNKDKIMAMLASGMIITKHDIPDQVKPSHAKPYIDDETRKVYQISQEQHLTKIASLLNEITSLKQSLKNKEDDKDMERSMKEDRCRMLREQGCY